MKKILYAKGIPFNGYLIYIKENALLYNAFNRITLDKEFNVEVEVAKNRNIDHYYNCKFNSKIILKFMERLKP